MKRWNDGTSYSAKKMKRMCKKTATAEPPLVLKVYHKVQ
jgi:hypothetical protein